MWPFSKKKLTEEEDGRVRRRCALPLATLRNCRAANADNPAACLSLEDQTVHCHAEVMCPQLAMEYQRCFRRVVNSKGKEPYSACEKEKQAMKRYLKQYKLYPFK